MVKFLDLLRHLRLLFRFRNGCLLNRKQEASGLTRFRSLGLRRLRNGVLHRARELRPGLLLKELRHDPVLVHFPDLPANAHRFHRGRADHGRLVIPTRVDLDNQGQLDSLHLSGPINPVPLGQLHRGDRSSLLAGHCLNPGARRKPLIRGIQGVLLKARTSQTLHLLDHLNSELQKARGQRTKRLLSRALLVARWTGTPRSTLY